MFKGTVGDSFFLMFVRVVTIVLGLFVTRVLSGHFSLQDYGTYSQIMLLVSTLSSMTILGMADGINFFFCKESNEKKRDAYVSTIFSMQYIVSAFASLIILCCTVPISKYFDNESLKPLMIFAAVLPVLQNTISLLQVMFIAIGKAKNIALRNFIVAVLRLLASMLACYIFDNIIVVLIFLVLMDVVQIVYFTFVLHKNDCKINLLKFDALLVKEILLYCIPMAMFTVVKSLNKDADKFVISYFTDTETLAIYSNASKYLPFDIIMTSFCTVLVPWVTRFIAQEKYSDLQNIYKAFLELSYTATAILAVAAICVAPELMRFLYTEKYLASSFGLAVFIIYILVDIFSFLNIVFVLSAAGKTKIIMYVSIGAFVLNIALNVLSFFVLKEIGPAVATLIVTLVQGILLISLTAKEIKTATFKLFDFKYLLCFVVELLICLACFFALRGLLVKLNVNYFVILIAVACLFMGVMFLINKGRLVKNLKIINSCKKSSSIK